MKRTIAFGKHYTVEVKFCNECFKSLPKTAVRIKLSAGINPINCKINRAAFSITLVPSNIILRFLTM